MTIHRLRHKVILRWHKAANAVGYLLTVKLADGRDFELREGPRSATATILDVPARDRIKVTIEGLGAGGLTGPRTSVAMGSYGVR